MVKAIEGKATTATTGEKVKDMRAAIQALKEKQPKGARPRVVWTAEQVTQLGKFITECRKEGITIGTMLTNYADFVAPHFIGKSKGAFELKARELDKAAKVAAEEAKEANEAEETDEFVVEAKQA